MSDTSATKIVRCCHCRGMMRVAAKALSVFCPHCQKRATLESLRIVGAHPGRSLATCGDILVEAPSQLNVEIVANNVTIRGKVNGSVSANECLEVDSTGRIYGDVRASKLIVRDGGVIQGRIEMLPSLTARAASAKTKESESPPQKEEAVRGSSLPPAPAVPGGAHGRGTTLPRAPQQIRPIRIE
ncbi:MAG: polymer-forming cytoskeletal protein [Planctomycetes bacterium]|nr:polymer-forming cytoskeletal protein [Planctomycetota bacterium]